MYRVRLGLSWHLSVSPGVWQCYTAGVIQHNDTQWATAALPSVFLSGILESNSQLSTDHNSRNNRGGIKKSYLNSVWQPGVPQTGAEGGRLCPHRDSASSGEWSPAAGPSAWQGARASGRRSLCPHWPPAAPARLPPWLRWCTTATATSYIYIALLSGSTEENVGQTNILQGVQKEIMQKVWFLHRGWLVLSSSLGLPWCWSNAFLINPQLAPVSLSLLQRRRRGEQSRAKPLDAQKGTSVFLFYYLFIYLDRSSWFSAKASLFFFKKLLSFFYGSFLLVCKCCSGYGSQEPPRNLPLGIAVRSRCLQQSGVYEERSVPRRRKGRSFAHTRSSLHLYYMEFILIKYSYM